MIARSSAPEPSAASAFSQPSGQAPAARVAAAGTLVGDAPQLGGTYVQAYERAKGEISEDNAEVALDALELEIDSDRTAALH